MNDLEKNVAAVCRDADLPDTLIALAAVLRAKAKGRDGYDYIVLSMLNLAKLELDKDTPKVHGPRRLRG